MRARKMLSGDFVMIFGLEPMSVTSQAATLGAHAINRRTLGLHQAAHNAVFKSRQRETTVGARGSAKW